MKDILESIKYISGLYLERNVGETKVAPLVSHQKKLSQDDAMAIRKAIESVVDNYSNWFQSNSLTQKELASLNTEMFSSIRLISLGSQAKQNSKVNYRKTSNKSLLSVLSKIDNENLHSDFIAALLDSHKMGIYAYALLEGLLVRCGFSKCQVDRSRPIKVEREKRLDEIDGQLRETEKGAHRIDILIRHNNFVIIIENKINTNESENQTVDYYQVVSKFYLQENGIPNRKIEVCGIFLTPVRTTPLEKKFVNITYRDLFAAIIEAKEKFISWAALVDNQDLSDKLHLLEIYTEVLFERFIETDIRYINLVNTFWEKKNEGSN